MSFWITIYFFSGLYSLFIGWMMINRNTEDSIQEINSLLRTWESVTNYEELRWLYVFCSFVPILNTCLLLFMSMIVAEEIWESIT